MASPVISPFRPTFRLILLAALPAAVALGALALLAADGGGLWAGLALACGAVVLGVAAAALFGILADLRGLAAYARDLVEAGGDAGAGSEAAVS
ncbi:MAG TPA: hypothetical protein VGC80_02205, partial [Acetobacteraceae bacterium]